MTGLTSCPLIFKHLLLVASQPKEQQLRSVTQSMFPQPAYGETINYQYPTYSNYFFPRYKSTN